MPQVTYHGTLPPVSYGSGWERILQESFSTYVSQGPGGTIVHRAPDRWVLKATFWAVGFDNWTLTARPAAGTTFQLPPGTEAWDPQAPSGVVDVLELRDAQGKLVLVVSGLAELGLDLFNLSWRGPLSGHDILIGTFADDYLWAGAGDDVINGGAGNDQAWVAQGDDLFDGGSGSDTALFGERGRYQLGRLSDGRIVVEGQDGSVVLTNVERLQFSDVTLEVANLGQVDLVGTSQADVLTGAAQGEVIRARGGHDVVRGLGGADTLFGQDGDDHLLGGDGDDVLLGGAGGDVLDGGAGHDIARFSGNLSDYQIWRDGDRIIVLGAEGKDVLIGVERIEFDNGVTAAPEPGLVVCFGEGGSQPKPAGKESGPLVQPDEVPTSGFARDFTGSRPVVTEMDWFL